MSHKTLNLHLSLSNFKYDSRILKETKSIAVSGIVEQVHIAAVWKEGLAEHEYLDGQRQVWRIRVRTRNQRFGLMGKIARSLEWQIRIFFKYWGTSITLINCHSISVLPLGLLFKIFSRSILVYDTHELETETALAVGIRRVVSKLVEKKLVHFVDAVITVNDSITHWYRSEYALDKVYTVRNVPLRLDDVRMEETSFLKKKLDIPQGELLFIYQGVLGRGRGIRILLDVFTKVPRWKHIVFMGYSDFEEDWEGLIGQYAQAHTNIHFHDAVNPEEVQQYTRGADVGICLIENISLSYYLSLPNKLFEYIMSGLPVIVSDFPEMIRVIDDGKCGWKVAVDRDALLSAILTLDRDEIIEKRNNARLYRRQIDWNREEKVLLQVYRDLGFNV
jgi:glycosyltransferase involved in cell wall biosynthesis